ncbi:hypothetical protein [Glycomyces tenuis]|uniref:hypothetical protein n=1 Tax=Glycomyces tenuis TaxID=58116 RepID=UPI000416959C|nr:hypothetical protein [Glycomyces tenuis]
MSHPSHSPYTPHHPYASPSGPPRRNTALIGGIVTACTALVLGSILLVTFVVNQDGGEGTATESEGADATSEAEEAADETPDGDPEEVAVAIVEIMMGMSDESSEGLLCSEPGMYLADPEATGETVAETLGETAELIDDVVAGDTTETGEGATVEVSMVVSGIETPFGTVDLVVEDGEWKACDFSY